MTFTLRINNRPFHAIKNGTKKVEARIQTSIDQTPYDRINSGDRCILINRDTQEKIDTVILNITHYENIREMLLKEGVQNVLSSGTDIEKGIENFYSFFEYKENIEKFGIYAIKLKIYK